jgi:hypothetical protein
MPDYSHLTLELSVAIPKKIFTGSILAYPGALTHCEIQIEVKTQLPNAPDFQKEAKKLMSGVKAWLKSVGVSANSPPTIYAVNETTYRLPVIALPEPWRKEKIATVGSPTTSSLFAIVSAAQDGIRSTLTQQKILGVSYAIHQAVIPPETHE